MQHHWTLINFKTWYVEILTANSFSVSKITVFRKSNLVSMSRVLISRFHVLGWSVWREREREKSKKNSFLSLNLNPWETWVRQMFERESKVIPLKREFSLTQWFLFSRFSAPSWYFLYFSFQGTKENTWSIKKKSLLSQDRWDNDEQRKSGFGREQKNKIKQSYVF